MGVDVGIKMGMEKAKKKEQLSVEGGKSGDQVQKIKKDKVKSKPNKKPPESKKVIGEQKDTGKENTKLKSET